MKKAVFGTLALLAALAIGGGGYLYFKDTVPPAITLSPGQGAVSKSRELVATAKDPSGIRTLTVEIVNGTKRKILASRNLAGELVASVTISLADAKLRNGPFTIEVTAVDKSYHQLGRGNAGTKSFDLEYDSKPPRFALQSLQHNINKGGSGAVAYRINEDVTKSGVRVGDNFFPGYKLPSGEYACIFAFPHDMSISEFAPVLEAEDMAGNRRLRPLPFHANDRKFRRDTINLPDSFLNAKMPQYEDTYPNAATQLERYLLVNGEMRADNRAKLIEIGKDTESRPLWSGKRFLRLPNAANRARYADHRTYKYNGNPVDAQTHLGIDLASVRNAQIPAAEAGRIVFAGFFGIYGEAVIIDHGLGLMTLYSHMSQIDVESGDTVSRGETIGLTGATGMAGGDHLHFGVLVSGVPVNPIEWWDARWIRHNILKRIGL